MNQNLLLLCIGVTLFFFQGIFFLSSLRWLANGRRNRDKEFALLDSERLKLLEMQSVLKQEMTEAKKISSETLNKLKIIGTEAHAEWEEVTKRINKVLLEVDQQSESLLQSNISQLVNHRLSLEKAILSACDSYEKLEESNTRAQKIFRLFDKKIPVDEIFKELQSDKYSEAKNLLKKGLDASDISKRLGLSLNEVILISSMT